MLKILYNKDELTKLIINYVDEKDKKDGLSNLINQIVY